jgi:cystathionine beta-lyase
VPANQFLLDRAKVAVSPGENFDPGADQFIRLNFATSQQILDEILNRIVRAAHEHSGGYLREGG